MTNPAGNQKVLDQFKKQFLKSALNHFEFYFQAIDILNQSLNGSNQSLKLLENDNSKKKEIETIKKQIKELKDKIKISNEIKTEITKFTKIIFFGSDFQEGEIPKNVEIFNKEILEEKNINKFNLYKNFFIKSFLTNDNFFDQNKQLKENDVLNLFKFLNEIFLSEHLNKGFSPIKNLEILKTLTKDGNQERMNNLFQIIQSSKKEDFKNEIIILIKNNNLNEENLNKLIEKLNIENKKLNELNLFINQINKINNEEVKNLLTDSLNEIKKLNIPEKLVFFKEIIEISYLNDSSSIQFFKQSDQKKTLFPIFVKNLVFYIQNNDQTKLDKVLEIFKERHDIFQNLNYQNFQRFINLILNNKIDVEKFKNYVLPHDFSHKIQVGFLNQFLKEDEKIIDALDPGKSGVTKEIFQLESKEEFIDFFKQQSIRKNVNKINLYIGLSIVIPIILFFIEFFIVDYLIDKIIKSLQIEKIQNPFLSKVAPICLYIFCCLALNLALFYIFDRIIVNEIKDIGEKRDLEDLKNKKSFWLELTSYEYNGSNEVTIGDWIISID